MREDVLAALGVLKVATAQQLQLLLRPTATTDRFIRDALLDLERHQLVVREGRTAARRQLWLLRGTPGLRAAGQVLDGGRDMGGTAAGAGRSGAAHAMAVNDTIVAFVSGGTDPGQAGGVGRVEDWSTETVHQLGPRRRLIPDAVLQAPEIGVPVLMVELDRSKMTPARVAAKFAVYRELFRRQVRNPDPRAGTDDIPKTVAAWTQLYPGQEREGYPPVALVVTDASDEVLRTRLTKIRDLAAEHWQPVRTRERYAGDDTWLSFTDAIPIIATTLDRLQEHGPMGPVWWRFGRPGARSLPDALDHWDDRIQYDARREAERAKSAEEQRQYRESRRCPTCHQLPDDGWYSSNSSSHKPGEECDRCARKRRERKAERRRQQELAQEAAERQAAIDRAQAEARALIEEREAAKLGNRARALLRRATKTTAED